MDETPSQPYPLSFLPSEYMNPEDYDDEYDSETDDDDDDEPMGQEPFLMGFMPMTQ